MEFNKLLHDGYAWLVVGFAFLIKVADAPVVSKFRFALSLVSAAAIAMIFGPPIIDYYKAGGSNLQYAILGCVVIFGENVIRVVAKLTSDPKSAIDLWKHFTGRDKGKP